MYNIYCNTHHLRVEPRTDRLESHYVLGYRHDKYADTRNAIP